MKERYAVVVKVRKQISTFTNSPDSVKPKNNILVDLQEHPQKNEVERNWFYDEETNTFSEEGTVTYPIPMPEPEVEFTQNDRIEAATEYLMAMQE